MAAITVYTVGAPPAFFKSYRDDFEMEVDFLPRVGEEVRIGLSVEFLFTVSRIVHDWTGSSKPAVYLTFSGSMQRG